MMTKNTSVNATKFEDLRLLVDGATLKAIWADTEMLERDKMELINQLGEYHGVEFLGNMKRDNAPVYYCNAGDTYAATIVFIGTRMTVTTWGDLVEGGHVKEFNNDDCY